MNLVRPISREFSRILKTRVNLLASIMTSLVLHLVAITALPSSTLRATHSGAGTTARLEVIITQQKLPVKPSRAIDTKIPEEAYRTNVGESRSEFVNASIQDKHDKSQGSIVVVEKPALHFVREIELDEVSDLSEDGYVEVEFLINPEGKVVNTFLKSTDIPIEFFELVAQTFKEAEFSPGKRDGVPVFEKLRFRVVFSKSTPH